MFKTINSCILSFLVCACLGTNSLEAKKLILEGRAAYFYPYSSLFRSLYSSSGIYGAELNYSFWNRLYGWMSADYLYTTGYSIGEQDPTSIRFLPIGVGLKYVYRKECMNPYIGAGLSSTYMYIHDASNYVIKGQTRWALGGIFKLGTFYWINERWTLDVFANYYYCQPNFTNTMQEKVVPHRADISGWLFGGGLGYRIKRCR